MTMLDICGPDMDVADSILKLNGGTSSGDAGDHEVRMPNPGAAMLGFSIEED